MNLSSLIKVRGAKREACIAAHEGGSKGAARVGSA